MRIFEAIFNYSIISPPLVLKPQSVEIGGAYFRVSTVYHQEYRAVACDVRVPVKWAWLRIFGGQPKKSMGKNNGEQVQTFAADN